MPRLPQPEAHFSWSFRQERCVVKERFFTHELENGLVLLAEELDHVVSVAMSLAVPAGASRDGTEMAGAGGLLAEWLFRGAGGRDSRALNSALDSLGCHHDEHVLSTFMHLSASQTGRSLQPVVSLYADILQRPSLSDDTFNLCRDLALQELASLEDQPARKCNLLLKERFYPVPLGVSSLGREQSLLAMSEEGMRGHAQRHLTPRGTILAVAGSLQWQALRDWVEESFGSWQGTRLPQVQTSAPTAGIACEQKDTAQMQISLAYAAPLVHEEHYYPMRVVEMILSGGMSGRLFAEVREKRGLVYSVHARYEGMKAAAGMFVYAGTTPERAQETLDVIVAELRRLDKGITHEELTRAKTQLKSALIMQGESTAARARGLANDWHLLRRLRSLEEIAHAIDAVTLEQVMSCLAAWPAENLTACFLGPEPLKTACLG